MDGRVTEALRLLREAGRLDLLADDGDRGARPARQVANGEPHRYAGRMGEVGCGRGGSGRMAVRRRIGGEMQGPEAGSLAWVGAPPAGHGEEAGRQARPSQHREEEQGTLSRERRGIEEGDPGGLVVGPAPWDEGGAQYGWLDGTAVRRRVSAGQGVSAVAPDRIGFCARR
ncbi:hypothetical protein NDU88_007069 [Pleurodeles waltl]|uniref:Uncharacterized protein n=1 Tax=Pleurodeles waltl TaxID=8319 RepID=A0AAV7TYM8_PLEWA|nr:hypothetical protein NDU88_007069 [Pleurodeles waltl]